MTNVLPGSSRAAFDFVVKHWRGLFNISIAPMAIVFAVTWYQLQKMGSLLEFIATQAKLGDKMDLAVMMPFLNKLSTFYAISLLSFLAMIWLFVRIVRFWKTGQGKAFGFVDGELGSTFLTLIYGLGMMLLTLLVYIAGIVGFIIVAGIGAAILGNSALAVVGSFVLVFIGLAMLLGLMLFMYRFLVGLPGVALGETPGFFSDIWPLAKGESWGLPVRMVLWSLVAMIPTGLILMTFTAPVMDDIQKQLLAQDVISFTPEMLSQLVQVMGPANIVNIIFQVPVIWFLTILLTEAHFRFRAKLVQNSSQ